MTNKQFIIKAVAKKFNVDELTVEPIFDAVHDRDYACFRSEMGDYDHPEERVEAKKEFEKFIESYKGEEEMEQVKDIASEISSHKDYNIHTTNLEHSSKHNNE